MKTPQPTRREGEPANTVTPAPQKASIGRSTRKGDTPDTILDRYLIERDRQGRPERYFRDHRAADPMIRDEGKRLVGHQSYPDTVADMIKIARHRGWAQIRVTGDEAFRRETWVQARTLGIEVKGYTPRDRDRQAAGERPKLPTRKRDDKPDPPPARVERRLRDAAVVVRRLVSDPAAQARLMEQAYRRAREITQRTIGDRDTTRSRTVETDRARR